jgi:2-iminoacetate synthase ThiH
VLAAFVRAGPPPGAEPLAAALGWPPERVVETLREAGADRLTAVQREALDIRCQRSHQPLAFAE